MQLEALFPRWRSLSLLPTEQWSFDTGFGSPETVGTLLPKLALDQSLACQRGRDYFYQMCKAITSDIISLQADRSPPYRTDPAVLTSIEYLQLESCLAPLKLAMNAGELHKVHDWIVNSLSSAFHEDPQGVMHPHRIYGFLHSPARWIVDNRAHTLSEWFSSFYYYSRVRAALPDVADYLAPLALLVCFLPNTELEDSVEVNRWLLDWMSVNQHPRAQAVATMLENSFNQPRFPRKLKARIAISFTSTAGFLTHRQPKDWAAWALENTPDLLHQHEPFQLLNATIDSVEKWNANRDLLLTHLNNFITSLRLEGRSPSSAALIRDQRSSLLMPITFKLHEFGTSDDLKCVLGKWYSVPDDLLRSSPVLFLLPNHVKGMALLGDDRHVLASANREARIVEMNRETNLALGITLTIQGETSPLVAPERRGQPSYDRAGNFEHALDGYYGFDSPDRDVYGKYGAAVSIPAYPHPIQALSQARVGKTFSNAVSLEEPEPDRGCKRVACWAAADDFYSAMEADAVETVLRRGGIEVTKFYGIDHGGLDFQRMYYDEGHDVIWVCGHGAYDHWNASSPSILLGGEAEVPIDSIARWEICGTGRRLLVLNICDGGGAAVLGGINRLGLAPMLACSRQATISHLWPVEPRVAAAFGVLLASELARPGMKFLEAFGKALARLNRSWEESVEEIRDLVSGELGERLQNAQLDMRNIFHWGSPCFFE